MRLLFMLLVMGIGAQEFTLQPAFAQDEASEEFAIKREFLRQRYQDFYVRLNQIDKESALREQGADEMRKERTRLVQQQEAARKAFVQERKARPPEDPKAWEREQIELRRQQELARKEYIRRREELNRVLKREAPIPEDEEYGLYWDETE